MDNVGIVVESLDAAISFFAELGLELEGRAMIEGDWSGRVTGLRDQRVEIAMMRAPDGHGRIELSRFLAPPVVADHRNAPVNALGYLRVMFAVDDLHLVGVVKLAGLEACSCKLELGMQYVGQRARCVPAARVAVFRRIVECLAHRCEQGFAHLAEAFDLLLRRRERELAPLAS